MKRNVIETVMGGVVLLIAAVFFFFAYSSANVGRVDGYTLIVKFNRVDGINVGSDVRISGIKVGTVVEERLDPKTYLAELRLSISNDLKLSTDASAKIQSDSLLSPNYVALEPGAETEMLADGGEITYTQDPINLSDLIGRFIFGAGEKKGPGKDQPAGEAPAAAPEPSTTQP